jgi:hypothetical protein
MKRKQKSEPAYYEATRKFDAVIAKVRATGYASLTREEANIFDAPSLVFQL